MKLQGQSAVITGASQGLGFAIARAFLKEGANIAICGRDEKQLRDAEAKLQLSNSHQCKIVAQKADISCDKDIENFLALAHTEMGNISVLVCNAGIYGPKGSLEDNDWSQWCQAIDINLKGTVNSCKMALPYLKQNKNNNSKIIILSGGGATKPLPNLSAYAVSKAAVVRFAETLAEELKSQNIDVNTVAPGALNTRLLSEILEAGPEKVGEQFYQQSLKQKETGGAPLSAGADLCVYLASEKSDGITGKLISAVWDPWQKFEDYREELITTDIYTLRRIVPKERGMEWGE